MFCTFGTTTTVTSVEQMRVFRRRINCADIVSVQVIIKYEANLF